jgi:hypothetical protein
MTSTKKTKLLALLMMVSFLISCSSIPSNAKLPLPPEIIYPSISLGDVSCLPKKTKEKIKKRDGMKSARIETLTNIIKKTH